MQILELLVWGFNWISSHSIGENFNIHNVSGETRRLNKCNLIDLPKLYREGPRSFNLFIFLYGCSLPQI